jgi:hypothetical protein
LAFASLPLDGLMMHTQSMSYRKERGVFPVGQQHPRPLDPARQLRSRPRYRNQPRHIFISDDNSIACRHAVMTFNLVLANQKPGYKPSWIT